MIALVRAELLKQRSIPTGRGLIAAMACLLVFAVALHGFSLPATRLAGRQDQFEFVFRWGALFGSLFAALLGTLSITGEFRHGNDPPSTAGDPATRPRPRREGRIRAALGRRVRRARRGPDGGRGGWHAEGPLGGHRARRRRLRAAARRRDHVRGAVGRDRRRSRRHRASAGPSARRTLGLAAVHREPVARVRSGGLASRPAPPGGAGRGRHGHTAPTRGRRCTASRCTRSSRSRRARTRSRVATSIEARVR